jgi:CBS domain-containing protein
MSEPSPSNTNEKGDETVSLKALVADRALHPDDSVKAAGERMREQHAKAWPVAEGRKLVGMVDEKNPDWELGGRGHDPETWQVGEIMSHESVFCYEDEDCARAAKLMEEHGLEVLPVVDRQMRIVGIFSRDEVKRRVG